MLQVCFGLQESGLCCVTLLRALLDRQTWYRVGKSSFVLCNQTLTLSQPIGLLDGGMIKQESLSLCRLFG